MKDKTTRLSNSSQKPPLSTKYMIKNSFKTEYVTCYLFSHIFSFVALTQKCVLHTRKQIKSSAKGIKLSFVLLSFLFLILYTRLLFPTHSSVQHALRRVISRFHSSHTVGYFFISHISFYGSFLNLLFDRLSKTITVCTLETVSGCPINVF